MSSERTKWSPHLWLGCGLFALLRIFWQGRFSFGLTKLGLVPIWLSVTLVHTFLRFVQQGIYGRRLRDTQIGQAPIFILGHWRSGTTLLHELLVLDPRHGFPTTSQCFDPMHFLLTDGLIHKYFKWLLPERRMMDNMLLGWARPQEEEFALVLLGQASPYTRIAFPNRIPHEFDTLDLDRLPRRHRDEWKRVFLRFLREVTFRDPRRLVLKSPPHTCRIPILLELFPDARFIHIVRDPVAVYFSTINLWKRLYAHQALHKPRFENLEQEVFETYLHMHRRVQATRGLVAKNRFHELRYEELTKDPIGELRRLYEGLELTDFDVLRPQLEAYLAANARYERNRWQPTPTEIETIERHWGEVMVHYGYPPSTDLART